MQIEELGEMVKGEFRRISSDLDAALGKQKKKTDEISAQVLDIEQKLARRGASGEGQILGSNGNELHALLENNADLAAVAARKSRRAVIELPRGHFAPPMAATLTSTGISYPSQLPGILAPAQRRLRIRSLIPAIPTDAGSVQYLRESGYTNNAAPVSEGDGKPESSLSFTLESTQVIVIAHWTRVSLQALSDIATLQSYLDGRLRYGLASVEETQLLKGSGVGENLEGLYTAATSYNGGGGTKIDQIRNAINQLELADFAASGIVLHPTDWKEMQQKKNANGDYIIGDPIGSNPPTLWGLPVITTSVMNEETFLVGSFSDAAQIFDRMEPRVEISTEDSSNFTSNLATVRCEERLGLAILRPEALIKGSFGS